MKRRMVLAVVLAAAVLLFAGCGNVYVKGEALTALETSTLDAYQAVQRADAEPAAPDWLKAYLSENFKQWRSFVRAARKDTDWGLKLEGE